MGLFSDIGALIGDMNDAVEDVKQFAADSAEELTASMGDIESSLQDSIDEINQISDTTQS